MCIGLLSKCSGLGNKLRAHMHTFNSMNNDVSLLPASETHKHSGLVVIDVAGPREGSLEREKGQESISVETVRLDGNDS